MPPPPPRSTLFPYTTLFRSARSLLTTSSTTSTTPRPRPTSPATSLTGPMPRSSSARSEEHTSELQSHVNLVCRLLLEKKKQRIFRSRHRLIRVAVRHLDGQG